MTVDWNTCTCTCISFKTLTLGGSLIVPRGACWKRSTFDNLPPVPSPPIDPAPKELFPREPPREPPPRLPPKDPLPKEPPPRGPVPRGVPPRVPPAELAPRELPSDRPGDESLRGAREPSPLSGARPGLRGLKTEHKKKQLRNTNNYKLHFRIQYPIFKLTWASIKVSFISTYLIVIWKDGHQDWLCKRCLLTENRLFITTVKTPPEVTYKSDICSVFLPHLLLLKILDLIHINVHCTCTCKCWAGVIS